MSQRFHQSELSHPARRRPAAVAEIAARTCHEDIKSESPGGQAADPSAQQLQAASILGPRRQLPQSRSMPWEEALEARRCAVVAGTRLCRQNRGKRMPPAWPVMQAKTNSTTTIVVAALVTAVPRGCARRGWQRPERLPHVGHARQLRLWIRQRNSGWLGPVYCSGRSGERR